MPRDPSFSPPVNELRVSTLDLPDIAVQPSAGQGFSLNEKGEVPIASKDGRWTMEYVTVSVDLPNIPHHTGGGDTAAIPGLAIGDLCFLIGVDADLGNNQQILRTSLPLCTTAGIHNFRYFNANNVDLNPTSVPYHFLVIHRFIP